jgi:hypothetical protein
MLISEVAYDSNGGKGLNFLIRQVRHGVDCGAVTTAHKIWERWLGAVFPRVQQERPPQGRHHRVHDSGFQRPSTRQLVALQFALRRDYSSGGGTCWPASRLPADGGGQAATLSACAFARYRLLMAFTGVERRRVSRLASP